MRGEGERGEGERGEGERGEGEGGEGEGGGRREGKERGGRRGRNIHTCTDKVLLKDNFLKACCIYYCVFVFRYFIKLLLVASLVFNHFMTAY